MSGDASDPSWSFLDRRHKRVGDQHRPADTESKLRPGLAVGADAGRIVVGRSRDEAWPQPLKEVVLNAVFCVLFARAFLARHLVLPAAIHPIAASANARR